MIKAFRKLRNFHEGFDSAELCLQSTIGTETCVKGCGKCCEHNTVRSMTIEAILAVSILTGSGKLAKALSLAEGWLLERQKGVTTYEGLSRIRQSLLTPNLREEMDIVTYSQCPFLAETKECIVHEIRPLVCRAYGITRTVESTFCPRKVGKGETLTQHQYIGMPELKADYDKFKEQYSKEKPEWVLFGFFPSLLFRAGNEKKFREYVNDNRIATVKLMGTQVETSLMWQPDETNIEKGVPAGSILVK